MIRGARLDRLLDAMLASMSEHPLPPPTCEIVVIQGRGLDRWISQQAALRQGGWGFVETLFPRPFLLRAFAAVLDGGAPALPIEDGVLRQELELRIAALLPDLPPEPRFESVTAALHRAAGGAGGSDGRAGAAEDRAHGSNGGAAADVATARRAALNGAALALAPRIAEVLDRCAQHRVDLVRGWMEERAPRTEHPDEPWLAEIWRRVAAGATPSRLVTDRERFVAACGTTGGAPPGLPERISVFGVSTLAPAFIELLEALARRVDVAIFALDPCPGERVHAMVREWGVESIEFAQLIDASVRRSGAVVERSGGPAPRAERSGLLATLQARLRGDDEQSAGVALSEDDTLMLRPCAGALHEVEAAHDAITALLRGDPTLEPRDVAVLTPDLERYGPIVEAVFSVRRDEYDGRATLPFTVADGDRSSAHAVESFARVLELALSRCELSAVLATLALEPIGAAFDLAPGDLDMLERWCDAAPVRWGLDAAHRALHGRPGEEIGTWRWGIDRLLLGAAAAEGAIGALGAAGEDPVAPLPAVEGSESARVRALQSFLEALALLAQAGADARPLAGDAAAVDGGVQRIGIGALEHRGADAPPADDWLSIIDATADRVLSRAPAHSAGAAIVRARLAAIRAAARASGYTGVERVISARAAVSLVVERLRESHPGRGLLAAGVTVAALQPMRSIPFRVIVLLGIGDGSIPRAVSHPSFDLVAAAPRPGDRTARLDDRQVMLETIMAASRSLVITWPGVDPTNGLPLPASVLVDELLDVLPEARPTATPHEIIAAASRERVAMESDRTASTMTSASMSMPASPTRTVSTISADAPAETAVTLDELERFWQSPAAGYLRAIGVRVERSQEPPPEEDPIGGECERALIDATMPLALGGDDALGMRDAPALWLEGRGIVPRGAAATRVLESVRTMLGAWSADADRLARRAGAADGLHESLTTLDVDMAIDVEPALSGERTSNPLRLTGRIPVLRGIGPLFVARDIEERHVLLRAWIRLLAARACGGVPGAPDGLGRLLLLERRASGDGQGRTMKLEARLIEAPPPDEARRQLAAFVALRRRGRREPILFAPVTSLEYAHHREKRNADEPSVALERTRAHFGAPRGELRDVAVRTLFDPPDRLFDARDVADPCSFVALAERLARPLMRAQKLGRTASKIEKARP